MNAFNKNSGVCFYIDLGDPSDPTIRTRLALLSQLMGYSASNKLRTEEQLGYSVSSDAWNAPGQCGYMIVVTSERPAAFVESRIENFLDWFLEQKLRPMTEEDFETHKKGCIISSTKDYQNFWEELSTFPFNASKDVCKVGYILTQSRTSGTRIM